MTSSWKTGPFSYRDILLDEAACPDKAILSKEVFFENRGKSGVA